ncbi:MAG: hypothetical protein BPHS0_41 [Phage 5P_3]|nr:MAG: hypothetical protein BPHS0_41 [Phage 5P_3]
MTQIADLEALGIEIASVSDEEFRREIARPGASRYAALHQIVRDLAADTDGSESAPMALICKNPANADTVLGSLRNFVGYRLTGWKIVGRRRNNKIFFRLERREEQA